ncbi:hypothetical protein Hanom_Chr03g00257681 [Helianthus anomalus]
MWKDLSQAVTTGSCGKILAMFLQRAKPRSYELAKPLPYVRSSQAVTAVIRAVSVNYLCRFSWLQAVLAGAKPLQKVGAVSTHGSSRFSWLRPFQTFIFSEWTL